MCFEPKYRACPQEFPGGKAPDSLNFLPLLLIRACYAGGFDNTYVDSYYNFKLDVVDILIFLSYHLQML